MEDSTLAAVKDVLDNDLQELLMNGNVDAVLLLKIQQVRKSVTQIMLLDQIDTLLRNT